LKCSETRKWREQILSRNVFVVNDEVAYKRIINCTNDVELRNTGKYLYKITCKWENKINNKYFEMGKGSRIIFIKIILYRKRIAPLEIVVLELWTAKMRTQSSVQNSTL
jgi:hypothetical protein